jgi:hypothetical protein
MGTIFTRIIEGEVPARFVWRDRSCGAFLNITPSSRATRSSSQRRDRPLDRSRSRAGRAPYVCLPGKRQGRPEKLRTE